LKREHFPDEVLILRLWREPGCESSANGVWRGKIKHLGSGCSHHFVGLNSLFSLQSRLLRQEQSPGTKAESEEQEVPVKRRKRGGYQ
jgi:hypothetical protein